MEHSVNSFEKLKLMANHFFTVKDLPGDVADLGTYRGGTAYVLRKLAPDKQLHLFDTWEGTPYDDPLCHHKKGEWSVCVAECKKVVGDAHYHPGVFPRFDHEPFTKNNPYDKQFCFVYVDMDTEQATKDAIEFFWPRMVPGGKMLFDDYNWVPCSGVKKAVDEAFPDEDCQQSSIVNGKTIKTVIDPLYTCVMVKP